ncbi:hypothetical protein PUN28_018942 [Cardiocondyla obscurior]|uniref:Uncharacterized protein n=1 Tax=Cardiocondyla obscurior TaxID=286306 RepID=A0AAW2EE13_9HYME
MSENSEHSPDDTETETKVMEDIPNNSSKSETKLMMNQMDAALLEDEEMPTYISMSSTTRPDDSDMNAKQSENESQTMERERSASPCPSDDQEANSIYVLSSGEETDVDQPPYNDEDDEDEYGDSDDMDNLELDNEFNSERSSNMKHLMDDEDDEEEDDEDDEDEEDSPRQMHNDDEGIEDNLEIDCYDGRSDDFLLNRRLKNRDKERSLSLQDLNAYRHDMNTEYLKKKHLQRYKPNYINIPEQQSIMYSMIQEKKRSVLGKYHYVQSKVKRYIKDIKEQNRHSLKKQHVEQQQENTNYNISNSNHKNNDTEKTKPVNIKTIKDYAEKTIKELEEISETYDSNVDKMAYSAMSPQIILNGQDNKNGLELIHEESTQNEIQITSYESTQNERDLANTDSKMQKQNGTIDIKQLKLNYPEKEISHFEDAVQPQLIQNGHQGTPAVHYHLRTLSYEEYMRGSSDSSQKTGLNKNAHVIEQDPIQPETYNNSDLMDISAENDDSCPLRIESIKSIKTMSDEAKTNNEQLIFKKINECSSNTTADSSEVTALKKKLTQKTVKYNNLLDTYQKQLMENLKMKQELDELRKTLAKYEKENKPPEQKVVSIQTDAVTESVHNQPQDESESTQTSQSNNKILGNSVISLSSIEQWSSGAGNLSISMKPPEVAKTLQSDDSIILTDNTPAKKHSLSRAFITSSRILQTLSSITQGKTKPENPLTQNSKKRINVNETMDLHSEDSSQPSSSKKRKIADIITPPNFLQAFIASESATESQSKLNEMSNIDSQFKNACDSINKNINFQASSSNTNASQLGATTSTTENKTNANDDAEDNVKCFIYHENENSKDRSFLILAEEPEKDKIIHEKGRIRECGPFLLGNIEVRMSEINGTINIWGKEISQESTAEIETETSSNAKDKSCHWQKTSHARFNGSNVVCSTSRKSKNPPKFELSSAASNFSCLHSPSFNIAKASCSTDKSHADKSYSPNMFSFENCDLSKHRNEWLRCKRTQPQEKLHSCCIHNTDTSEEKCNCSLHKQKFEDNFNCSKEKCSGQEHQRSFSKNLEPNKHLYENITPEEDHVCRNDTSCHHSLHNSESCQEPHKCNKETCELLINREFNELCNHSPNILSDEEPLISLQCSETPDTRRRRLTGKRVRGILMDLIRGCGDCYNPNVSDNTSKSCMHKKDSYLRCPPEVKISPCASPEPTYSRTGQPAGRCCHAYAQRIESQLEEFRMEMEKMRSRSDAILNMLNMLHSVDTN